MQKRDKEVDKLYQQVLDTVTKMIEESPAADKIVNVAIEFFIDDTVREGDAPADPPPIAVATFDGTVN